MEQRFEEILAKIGLTSQEARTYLALLKLKECQTGTLCKETGIASSNIYKILDSLLQKGLVSYKLKNNIKVFMPSNPEALNELFLEREKKLDEERKEVKELISNLKIPKQEQEPYSNYKYFEGISGIKALWLEMASSLSTLEKGEVTRVYTGKKEIYEKLAGFYDEFHKIRLKLGGGYKIIFPFEDRATGERRKKQHSEVKYMDLNNEAEWGVLGDKFFIQTLTGKTLSAFLITDKKMADTFKQTFEQLWKLAKK
jgi:HTH-type transcriptional regulator, sugar sensing transcriptional regulator